MRDRGQTSSAEAVDRLAARELVWVRLGAARIEGAWTQVVFEAVGGEAPPRWTRQLWQYEDALFVSTELSGDEVVAWLRRGAATVAGVEVRLPAVDDLVQWERRASGSFYRFEPLLWAHVMYTLSSPPAFYASASEPLIGPAAPSFVTFAAAAAAFFGVPVPPGSAFDHVHSTFRDQDLGGRISSVRYGLAGVSVEVEGSALEGSIIELAYEGGSMSSALNGATPAAVEFDLAGLGLPPGSWVVLKRGHEWLDRKFLNWPMTATPDPGVEAVPDPRTQLEDLVLSGEGLRVEFKVQLPTDRDGRHNVARTVAAFANAEGGSIVFGVRNHDGALLGIPANEVRQTAEDAITNFVRSLVTPLPSYTLTRYELGGSGDRVALVLEVEAGHSPPYGVDPANPRFYVRRGATTFPASAEQVRALARSRPAADDSRAGRFGVWVP